MTFARLIGCVLIAATLGSCLAPARVWRVKHQAWVATTNADAHLHDLLNKALADPESPESRRALAHFVECWHKAHGNTTSGLLPAAADSNAPDYQVVFSGADHDCAPLTYFDELHAATDYKVFLLAHHQRPGLGAPLLALRENREREAIERYYPPEAIARPLTAVAQAQPARAGRQEVRIELLCPLVHDTVRWRGKQQPLAADFTLPWAAALSRTGKLRQARVLDMITPKPKHQPQLYLMEPYDPRKEPLIMIHGLLDTPLAWAGLSNDLWADPDIRRRYQIWHYLYNTSAPALHSARLLRAQLKELRAELDPQGGDLASRRATLVTHSMGGLIGKSLVVRPGDAFWNAAFTMPHQSLKLDPEDRAQLIDAFEWEPDPSIHRIIFIAVPHRGSAFADNIIGRIGTWLTSPPVAYQEFYRRVSSANPGAFTPAYRALGEGQLDSVSALSPRQPSLAILAELPYAHPVKVHSIIGNRGRNGPLADSSDGIVPYSSSHLEDVDSELVVPARHAAYRHPEAVAEIKRILKLP